MILAALLGGGVGLVLALTGAGGGLLAVPLLVVGLGLSVHQAAPVGLMAVGLSSAVGAISGWCQGRVRYRAAALMGGFGVLLAPVGTWLAGHLPNSLLSTGFALVMLWTALRLVRRWSPRSAEVPDAVAVSAPGRACIRNPCSGRFIWTQACARALAMTGAVSGTLTGLLGVGGGFVIVPALTRHSDLPPQSIVSTSLAVIALVSVSGVTTAAMAGVVNWGVAVPFGAGAVMTQWLTARRLDHLNGRAVQLAFAGVCVLTAAVLVLRSGGL